MDCKVTCKSTCLGKKEKRKIRPVKIVCRWYSQNPFMKNKINPPDEFRNLSIKHDMAADKRINESLLQDIANEKIVHQTKIEKTSFL